MPGLSHVRQQMRRMVRRLAARGKLLDRRRLREQVERELNQMSQQAREEFAQELEDLWSYVYGGTLRRDFRVENLLLIGHYGSQIDLFYKKLSERANCRLATEISAKLAAGESAEEIAQMLRRKWQLPYSQLAATVRGIARASSRANAVLTALRNGIGAFRYAGPKDGLNRPFCAKKVGKVFTYQQIVKEENDFGQVAWLFCGGWNCRHYWEPVPIEKISEEEWEKFGREEKRQIQQAEHHVFIPDQVVRQMVRAMNRGQDGSYTLQVGEGSVVFSRQYLARRGRHFIRGNAQEVENGFREISAGLVLAQRGEKVVLQEGKNLKGGDVDLWVLEGKQKEVVEVKHVLRANGLEGVLSRAFKKPQARRMVIFCIEGSIEEIRGIMDSIEPAVVKVPLTVDVYRVRRQRIEFVGTWRYGND